MAPDPREELRSQAERVRRISRGLDAAERAALLTRLRRSEDPWDQAWIPILEGRHPLADWLNSDAPFDALPPDWPRGGPSARQLISSHPFAGFHPWFKLPTSPESSETPRG